MRISLLLEAVFTALAFGSPVPEAASIDLDATSQKPLKQSLAATRGTKTTFAGVNLSGFDFGCQQDGSFVASSMTPPLSSKGGPDGIGQMKHFATNDKLNVFRLPVAWQYLQPSLGGALDSSHLSEYDQLMQGCLATGAHCIIDIHNYARYNGGIVGQGGPSDAQFANLWSRLAAKYAGSANVIFGLMNEPHDLPSVTTWANTIQAAVTAIRKAGATSQMILLPGNNYTSAGAFVGNGSGPALLKVVNLDQSTTNLIFDVHQYLDSDFSGTHTECVTNNISNAFSPLATWLRANKRMAFNTETGGGNTASCEKYLCQQLDYLNQNADVFIGYVGWAAGSFDQSYQLVLTPTWSNGAWTDTALMKSCIAR